MDEKEMANECMRLIRVTIRQLTKTNDFLSLDLQSLKFILASEILDIEELDLFHSVDKWCIFQLENQEKEISPEAKRELLGDAINLLRFPTFSAKIFTNSCYPSGLITKDQFVDFVSFLMSEEPDKHEKMDLKKIPFEATARGKNNCSLVLSRAKTSISQDYGSWFMFERKIWLKGITLGGPVGLGVLLCSIQGNDGTYIKPEITICDFTEDTREYSHIIFEIPVKILPNVGYNILCQHPVVCSKLERHLRQLQLLGEGAAPEKSPRKPAPLCQRSSSFPVKFSKPQLCKCFDTDLQKFYQLIYSEIDDQPIQNEEPIFFHAQYDLQDY